MLGMLTNTSFSLIAFWFWSSALKHHVCKKKEWENKCYIFLYCYNQHQKSFYWKDKKVEKDKREKQRRKWLFLQKQSLIVVYIPVSVGSWYFCMSIVEKCFSTVICVMAWTPTLRWYDGFHREDQDQRVHMLSHGISSLTCSAPDFSLSFPPSSIHLLPAFSLSQDW